MNQFAKDRLFQFKMILDIIRIQLSFVKTLKKEQGNVTPLKVLLSEKKKLEKYLKKKRTISEFHYQRAVINYKKILYQIRAIQRITYWRTLELKFLKLIEKEKKYA